jgi:hypothetical protein
VTDIDDPRRDGRDGFAAALARGRWNWTRGGYETGLPRGCQFTDLDAVIEIDGRVLIIEAVHHASPTDPVDLGGRPPMGQRVALRRLAALDEDVRVFVLYGNAQANDPQAALLLAPWPSGDRLLNWRPFPLVERRLRLRRLIEELLLGRAWHQ